jgi:hypothetical protein
LKNAINLINLSGVAKSNTVPEPPLLLSLTVMYRVRCADAILALKHTDFDRYFFPFPSESLCKFHGTDVPENRPSKFVMEAYDESAI